MAKASLAANGPKAGSAAPDRGGHQELGSAQKETGSAAGKITPDNRAERAAVARLLRDIRENAGKLTIRADHLLRRVS